MDGGDYLQFAGLRSDSGYQAASLTISAGHPLTAGKCT